MMEDRVVREALNLAVVGSAIGGLTNRRDLLVESNQAFLCY
jgi:hypothetical protein